MGNNSEDFLYLIDQIEEIRSKNNKNWMDILRVAFSHAPDETKKLIKKPLVCFRSNTNRTSLTDDQAMFVGP